LSLRFPAVLAHPPSSAPFHVAGVPEACLIVSDEAVPRLQIACEVVAQSGNRDKAPHRDRVKSGFVQVEAKFP
jgi:hypothetical protein